MAAEKKLTSFIASDDFLKDGQKLFTNVRETAYSFRKPEPNLRSNADEGDLRVWFHSTANKKLIFSPDTDWLAYMHS